MISVNSNVNYPQGKMYKPSFGSVILSRVVLRTVEKNGDVYYTPLMNNEKGIVGVYQSLSRRVNSAKKQDYLRKLAEIIPDFNIKNPIIHSTLIGVRSSFKRFLLTGADARKARDLGTDLIGALDNRRSYASMMKEEILNKSSKRVFNSDGNEIGIDLIVEGQKGKRKLVDIEISTLHEISRAKKPQLKSNQKELKKLNQITETTEQVKKDEVFKQNEFNFVSELQPKSSNFLDFD